MRTVSISGTSLQTSRLGIGSSSLHHLLSSKARQSLLVAAWDSGIRYFDTAPLYGHHLAEKELGKFIGPRRGELVLATKFGILPNLLFVRAPALMYAEKFVRRLTVGSRLGASAPRRSYRATDLRCSVEQSLRNFRTDHIDILYLHEPTLEQLVDADTTVAEVGRLKTEGKLRYFGLSGSANECQRIAARYPSLAEVLQLEVPTSGSPGSQVEPLAGQVTFGHFRRAGLEDRNESSADWVRRSLERGVKLNPNGAMLFSTRSAHHLDEVVRILEEIEREGRA
jgi:aryl-alcohol dehydrogenase-like predicted oxidoreductase